MRLELAPLGIPKVASGIILSQDPPSILPVLGHQEIREHLSSLRTVLGNTVAQHLGLCDPNTCDETGKLTSAICPESRARSWATPLVKACQRLSVGGDGEGEGEGHRVAGSRSDTYP